MRLAPLVILFALVTGGCMARLPVHGTARPLVPGYGPSASTPAVSEERMRRAAERAMGPDECFVRCGLTESVEGREPQEMFEAEEAEEEFEPYEISVFLGYTFERGEGGATIGLDFVRWFSPRFGAGPFLDYVAGDLDAFAVGIGTLIRPVPQLEDLTFYVGGGVDISNEEEEEGGRTWEARPMIRLGVMYGFPQPRNFRIIPTFFFDVILPGKQAYVMGLTIGKEF